MGNAVLRREIDSYQRALDTYRRQAGAYNSKVGKYRDTFVRDADDHIVLMQDNGTLIALGADGKPTSLNLPEGFDVSGYGLQPLGGGYSTIRKNPTAVNRETVTGVQRTDASEGSPAVYFTPEGESGQKQYGAEWRLDGEQVDASADGRTTYTMSRDASTYMPAPPEWTKAFKMAAPDPTLAQIRNMNTPSMAEQERGLVGEVLQGRGIR